MALEQQVCESGAREIHAKVGLAYASVASVGGGYRYAAAAAEGLRIGILIAQLARKAPLLLLIDDAQKLASSGE